MRQSSPSGGVPPSLTTSTSQLGKDVLSRLRGDAIAYAPRITTQLIIENAGARWRPPMQRQPLGKRLISSHVSGKLGVRIRDGRAKNETSGYPEVGNVVLSLRDVNEPVNMLTTTSPRLEASRIHRPVSETLPPSVPSFPFHPAFAAAPSSSDEMIIIVRNRRAAHFRACGSRRIIFHPLK